MPEYSPEGSATKWSLLAAYNSASSELNYIEPVHMEDTTKGLKVANYVYDTTTSSWVAQNQNVLITDSVYLAVDDLETLINSSNTNYLIYIKQSLQIMDDWDESDRAKVNIISGQAGITGGAGAVGASTPRVTLASDDPAVTHLSTLAGVVGTSGFEAEVISNKITVEASTTTPLGASASWESAEIDLLGRSAFSVYVTTNKASASNGLEISQSHDATNWDIHYHSVTADTQHKVVLPATARYARVKYTNGNQAQGTFRLHVLSYALPPGAYYENIEGDIEADDLALVTKSIIAGETTAGGGGYVNVKVNASGALTVEADQADTVWAVQWSEGLTELQTLVAQSDTDFGALLVYAEQHDTDFGTMISHLSAIQTAVQIMDDWDLNDRCRVSPISGQDGVQAGEGAISATTQRVTIATDDDMVTDVSSLLTETQDNKQDYFLDSWLVSGTDVYVAKTDKDGNYMIIKHDTTAGSVTYESGTGGVPSSTGWAALAYQGYETEF